MNPFFNYFKQYRKTVSQSYFRDQPARAKQYMHAVEVSLPEAADLNDSLLQTLRNRTSDTNFSGTSISLQDFSTLLFYGLGECTDLKGTKESKRCASYPSGGQKYPIETYCMIRTIESITPGLYHYRPDTHKLETLNTDLSFNPDNPLGSEYYKDASVTLFFSYIQERSVPKYGYLAHKLGLIETGHIGQNIYLLACALSLKCCAIGMFEEDEFHKALDIDGYNETLIYAISLDGMK